MHTWRVWKKNGYIRRDPTKPRAIEIVDDNFNLVRREMVNVPVLGRVAAGEPLLAIENVESYFPIPAEFMPNAQTFILNVVGESMINAGILDGDKVIVEQTADAQNGDIVVALVDDSATVKSFTKKKTVIVSSRKTITWIRSSYMISCKFLARSSVYIGLWNNLFKINVK